MAKDKTPIDLAKIRQMKEAKVSETKNTDMKKATKLLNEQLKQSEGFISFMFDKDGKAQAIMGGSLDLLPVIGYMEVMKIQLSDIALGQSSTDFYEEDTDNDI